MSDIFRVTVRTTNSVQPDSTTTWHTEVLYCGTDREQARIAFHAAAPSDHWRGYGNKARETSVEVIEDATTADFSDDPVRVMEG